MKHTVENVHHMQTVYNYMYFISFWETVKIVGPSVLWNTWWTIARGHWPQAVVDPTFSKKSRGILFSAFCGACGAWFRIFSRYLFPLTPPTVFVRSFWNFTGALRMVWRYACVFFQNPEIIFYHFLHILNLDNFWVLILQKSIGSRYLVPLLLP